MKSMAAVNSVQNGLHLPLNGITSHPRVLMCSASLGSEGSVTLQLHEAIDTCNSDSPSPSLSSTSSTGISATVGGVNCNSNVNSSSLDTALTAIGYPDPDLIADVLGTLQAAAAFNSNTMLSTTNQNIGVMCKTQKISTSSAGSNGSIILSRNNNSNSNSPPLCGQIVSIDTMSKTTKIISSVPSTNTSSTTNIVTPPNIITTTTPVTTTRRSRPKTSSPTRHGPQQCQVCNKIFGNASALAKHKLTHSDERKYVCVMCTKAFKRQDHLNGHMLTHRNKKPYECKAEGCGKSYCDARSLRRHTENHHQGLVAGTTAATTTTTSTTSTAVLTAKTPNNLSLLSSPGSSTGPPTGLSLSPATANGDASSPGASASSSACIQYTITGEKSKPSSPRSSSTGSTTSTFSSSSSSSSSVSSTTSPLTSLSLTTIPSSVTGASSSCAVSLSTLSTTSATTQTSLVTGGNEGLTKQQLDLISQIMQQTKQGIKQVTVSTTSGNSTIVNATSSTFQNINNNNGLKNNNIQQQQQQSTQQQQQQHHQPHHQQQQQHHIQRPRTWNMQTTQLKQNQMKISAMSVETVGTVTSDMKSTTNVIQQHNQLQTHHSQQILNIVKIENKPVECNLCHRKFKNIPALNGHMRLHGGYFKKDAEPKKTEKKENSGPPLQTASIGVRALIEEKIINKRCKDLKGAFVVPAPPITTNNSTSTISTSTSSDLESFLTPKSPIKPSVLSANQHKIQKVMTNNQGTSTRLSNHTKDATLIELLKRGTKVAIKRATPEPTVAPLPATSPLSITLANGERAPVALTIQQSPTGSTDVFTLTYSADSPSFNIADTEVYTDATMLLQAVDSIEILQNDSGATTSGTTTTEQISDISELSEFAFTDSSSGQTKIVTQEYTTSSKELQDILNNSYPLHSKDFIIYNNNNNNSVGDKMTISPLPSPIGYPTPPASQEAVAQTSPFLDDSHHFSDAASSYFEESKPCLEYLEEASRNYYNSTKRENDDEQNLTEDEKIMKLKSALEDEHIDLFKSEMDSSSPSDNFDINVKVEDLLNDTTDGEQCDFSDQNLSFLDDAQNFLDDDGNPTSPLSESFFASDEVKEVLKDVLPPSNSNSNQQADDSVTGDNDIDLFYLPSLTLQSQMMSTSDDPLLSSSPREFGQQRMQQFPSSQLINNNIESYTGPSNNKKLRTDEYIPLIMTTTEPLPSTTTSSSSSSAVLTTSIAAVNPSPNDEFMVEQNTKQHQPSIDNSVCTTYVNSTSMETIMNCQPVFPGGMNANFKILQPPPATTNSILKRRLRQGSYSTLNGLPFVMPKKQEVFKSKLRRPSTTHYTPSPLLNPERKAPGLYSNLPKSMLHQDTLDLGDEFENASCNSLVSCFLDDSKVNIGTAYQATIPPLSVEGDENNNNHNRASFYNTCNYMFSSSNEDDDDGGGNTGGEEDYHVRVDEKIWDPSVQTDDKLLGRFIELSKSSAIPLGYHSEEVALKTLYKCNGDTHVAVLELLQRPSEGVHFKWQPIEIEIFLKGLEKYGKDFYKISKEITTKTIKDCIQLYYFWKKICGDYKTTHLKREVETDNHQPCGSSSSVFAEPRPFLCEMPDCSASFTSKGALHSHTRIHGRNGLPGFSQIASTSGFLTK
ncbi:TRERF1 family protein [Megaselia abdita]